MNKVRKWYQSIMVMLLTAFVMPMAAMAESSGLTLPSTVDISDLFPYASAIIAALVTLIVIRKAIKLSNRS